MWGAIFKTLAKKKLKNAVKNDSGKTASPFSGNAKFATLGCLGSATFFSLLIFMSIIILIFPAAAFVEMVTNTVGGVAGFFSSLGNWFAGKDWCANAAECYQLAEQNYYAKLESLIEEYKKDGIELDKELLIGTTISYYNVSRESGFGGTINDTSTPTEEDNLETEAEKFREGNSKLAVLAKQMVANKTLSLNSYYRYLINTYVEENFRELIAHYSGEEYEYHKRRVADEIMSFSLQWQGGYEFSSVMGGCQQVTVTKPGGEVIGTFPIEEYIAGVVAAENGSAPFEALKAQAVLARSYLNFLNKDTKDCKIESSSNKQNFNQSRTNDNHRRAANETAGQLLLDKYGNLFKTEYDSFFTQTSKDANGSGGYRCDSSYCYVSYYRIDSSNKKDWQVHELKIPISYKGRFNGGHGRGMSQVMANYLVSDENYDYVKVLQYFYADGVKIGSVTDGEYASDAQFYEGSYGFNGKIFYYNQVDYDRPNSFRPGKTIKTSGCGVTSLAIVVSSLLGEAHDPYELQNKTCKNSGNPVAIHSCENGTATGAMTAVPKLFGLKAEKRASFEHQYVIDALKSGNSLVIAHMGCCTFTKEGHYIVLAGANENGEVLVYDPNAGEKRGTNKLWKLSLIVRELKGNFYIISR